VATGGDRLKCGVAHDHGHEVDAAVAGRQDADQRYLTTVGDRLQLLGTSQRSAARPGDDPKTLVLR
jgi:hypothetical protein